MAGGSSPARAILYAFGANLGIALAKTVATVFTGSSSMLAEKINRLEARLKSEFPEIGWCFVEFDVTD